MTPLLVCGALAVAVTGWSGQAPSASERTGWSVEALTAEAGAGWHLDYQPLRSAADAVERADLIVTGTLIRVGEGIAIEYRNGTGIDRDDGYATYQVRVDRVISDRALTDRGAGLAGTVINVAMRIGATTTVERLNRLNPGARTVLVLADRSTWSPLPGATVVRPAGMPADAPLFAPYTDGVWLQGPADGRMFGVGVEAADLQPGWGSARTVDQYAERLTAAAVRS
ncbi:hypothetical protein O7627_17555 [Solwaraspora sp. WMMD1047]|uniref:hypothetical protein n=1 Tax=Solwaraspora sp. WMMD1047 TaxID=3016102 RepID=UPI002416B1BA|nr:hypothetical protein [Solwaraspora sp. WMMD1047]MDG4831103.1 hypothetical protein [Solwaraspora sp. WMMD1047]